MGIILCIIAAMTLVYLLFTNIEMVIGLRLLAKLREQQLVDSTELPSISIIVSALNEEDVIESALTSLLNINYPHLEIIAIDDRSEDKTYAKMMQVKDRYPQLQVYQIKELPDKWFGKNHALNYGAEHANGEWLLFTDADVTMKSDLLNKSMSYILNNKVDHLTIFEHHICAEFNLKTVLFGLYLPYLMFCKPWRIRYAWSKKACGHGAFNLVNKKVYFACGAHKAIAMECLDDVKLGELIKINGYRQETVDGRDYLERGNGILLEELLSGMKKNSSAFRDYKILPIIIDSTLSFLFYIWPIIAVLLCSGPMFWINSLNIVLMIMISLQVTREFRIHPGYSLLYPISISFLLFSMWNSLVTVLLNGGVIWRGTLYPLKMIRSRNYLGRQLKKE